MAGRTASSASPRSPDTGGLPRALAAASAMANVPAARSLRASQKSDQIACASAERIHSGCSSFGGRVTASVRPASSGSRQSRMSKASRSLPLLVARRWSSAAAVCHFSSSPIGVAREFWSSASHTYKEEEPTRIAPISVADVRPRSFCHTDTSQPIITAATLIVESSQ